MDALTVSQVAKECSVSTQTVRYYEKRGLLRKPARTESGYRLYVSETVEDIRFIRSAQDLGFTLKEIEKLLSIYRGEDRFPIEEMKEYTLVKMNEIEKKIDQLNKCKTILELVTNRTKQVEPPLSKNDCPVITIISNGGLYNGPN